jgi:SAM-dependent methyltransferase
MALPSKCTLCANGSDSQSVLTTHVYGDNNHEHAFFKCAACNVIYLYPQLTAEQEHKFYAQEFEGFMNVRSGDVAGWDAPEKHIKANQQQQARRWEYLKDVLPKTGKILELGCSSGFMLYPLVDKGYECFGIEPSGYFSEYVRSRGIKVFEKSESIEEKFDVLMHFFVLEHVKEPIKFINSNLSLLKPGGKLIIEIPNAADPLYTIYDIPAFEKFYWSIAHHWYFDEKSASYMLSQIQNINYEIVRDQRYDLSNHMVWARDGKPGGMARFANDFGPTLDKVYKEALIESGKCDTLILVITKGL